MEKRMREIGRKWERKDREKRRRNVIVKGIKTEDKQIEKAVRKLLNVKGLEGEVQWIKELENRKEDGGGMAAVRMKEGAGKREIMLKNRKVRGWRERIEDDLTFEER